MFRLIFKDKDVNSFFLKTILLDTKDFDIIIIVGWFEDFSEMVFEGIQFSV